MSSGHDSERGDVTTATRKLTQDNPSRTGDIGATAGDAFAQGSEALQQAGRQAKEAASSLASEANRKVKGLMNQQIGAGADLVGHVAESVRSAADNLDRNAPQLAGLVRGAADRIDEFSESVRDQSMEELWQSASQFARRKPALVFGAAATCGFLLVRLLRTVPTDGFGASRQHRQDFGDERWRREWEGEEDWRAGQGMHGSQIGQSRAGQFHGV
jgi:ElaB/YqjD/DUF883 family membrane-anchored ribosome-binding protein